MNQPDQQPSSSPWPTAAIDESTPASGAWTPADGDGDRCFLTIARDHPLVLEAGGSLRDVTIAYETWGRLDAAGRNAVLVCHALTGDSHASGAQEPGHATSGWWAELIGPGLAIDTDRYFVVCVNVIGGCQGSTGPASPNPRTGKPYGSRFPVVTARDMVRTQCRLADHLGVDRWLSVLGGSMGAMQALEWAVMFPDRVQSLVPIAVGARSSGWQVAYSRVGRQAIVLDPNWQDGEYYESGPGGGPHRGLAVARALAQITYRSDQEFESRFHRDLAESGDGMGLWDRFQVESYLDHHGRKLAHRFDANSYITLNKAMDLHDIGRDRGGVAAALGRVRVPTLVVSVNSDTLYPPHQQVEIRDLLASQGTQTDYLTIDSPHGHDGFLIESGQLGPVVRDWLARVEKV